MRYKQLEYCYLGVKWAFGIKYSWLFRKGHIRISFISPPPSFSELVDKIKVATDARAEVGVEVIFFGTDLIAFRGMRDLIIRL